jgi:hypothetical protein
MTYLLRADGLLGSLVELLDGLGVVAQILLTANQDDRETLAKVQNLGNPLLNMSAAMLRLFRCSRGAVFRSFFVPRKMEVHVTRTFS